MFVIFDTLNVLIANKNQCFLSLENKVLRALLVKTLSINKTKSFKTKNNILKSYISYYFIFI